MHDEQRHPRLLVLNGFLNFGAEAAVLLFRTPKAPDHRVVQLLADAWDGPAARFDGLLIGHAGPENEVAGKAEELVGKFDPFKAIDWQLAHEARIGNLVQFAADKLTQCLGEMTAFFLGYKPVRPDAFDLGFDHRAWPRHANCFGLDWSSSESIALRSLPSISRCMLTISVARCNGRS